MASVGSVSTADIGAFENLSADIFSTTPGTSHRVKTITTNVVNAYKNTIEDDTASATQTETRVDGLTGKSAVVIKAAADYPFSMFAPDIDYDIAFTFERIANGATKIKVAGWHDSFPGYEIIINGTVMYSHYPQDSGPSIWNLGGYSTVNVSGSVTVLPPGAE